MRKSLGILLFLPIAVAGCKTTGNSAAKAIPSAAAISEMTLEQWVKVCQAELADPQTGASSKAYLLQATKTSDCAEAYPIVENLVRVAIAPKS